MVFLGRRRPVSALPSGGRFRGGKTHALPPHSENWGGKCPPCPPGWYAHAHASPVFGRNIDAKGEWHRRSDSRWVADPPSTTRRLSLTPVGLDGCTHVVRRGDGGTPALVSPVVAPPGNVEQQAAYSIRCGVGQRRLFGFGHGDSSVWHERLLYFVSNNLGNGE